MNNKRILTRKSVKESQEEAQDEFIKCCICGEEVKDIYSNNAQPYAKGRCCDKCNWQYVIPARLDRIKFENLKKKEKMKRRINKQKSIKESYGEWKALDYEITGNGEYCVKVRCPIDKRDYWVDVWIDEKDVEADWNQYIFSNYSDDDIERKEIQEDDVNFDLATSIAVYYLEELGFINQDNNGKWYISNKQKSIKESYEDLDDAFEFICEEIVDECKKYCSDCDITVDDVYFDDDRAWSLYVLGSQLGLSCNRFGAFRNYHGGGMRDAIQHNGRTQDGTIKLGQFFAKKLAEIEDLINKGYEDEEDWNKPTGVLLGEKMKQRKSMSNRLKLKEDWNKPTTYIYKISDRMYIFYCTSEKTRTSFRHLVTLSVVEGKGIRNASSTIGKGKVVYYNRTWEMFEFQSAMIQAVKDAIKLYTDVRENEVIRQDLEKLLKAVHDNKEPEEEGVEVLKEERNCPSKVEISFEDLSKEEVEMYGDFDDNNIKRDIKKYLKNKYKCDVEDLDFSLLDKDGYVVVKNIKWSKDKKENLIKKFDARKKFLEEKERKNRLVRESKESRRTIKRG